MNPYYHMAFGPNRNGQSSSSQQAAAPGSASSNNPANPAAAAVGASSSRTVGSIPPIPECAENPHRYSIPDLEAAKDLLAAIIWQNNRHSSDPAHWNAVSAKYVHAHGWISWHIGHKQEVALGKFIAGLK